jgi:hypothetical protein
MEGATAYLLNVPVGYGDVETPQLAVPIHEGAPAAPFRPSAPQRHQQGRAHVRDNRLQ